MDGVREAVILRRHHVIARIGADYGNATLVEQWQTGRLARGGAGRRWIDRPFLIAPV
jgi:hypothetical protein